MNPREKRLAVLRERAANGDVDYRQLDKFELWSLILVGDSEAEREHSRRN